MGQKLSVTDARIDPERASNDGAPDPFADLHPPLTATQAVVEAGRCLYCYEAPCIAACPTGIDIPTFIHQIRTGNLVGSAETILEANIMGGTCARACPTEILCEQACVLNAREGEPVEIGRLQRHAVDHLLTAGGPHPFTRAPGTGKRIAVVGAGPAGLAFAHEAARRGHEVTVFDARPKPGGLNEYGLAAYKMVNDFAQKEVKFILGIGGIELRLGHCLGKELKLADLRADYDAVFIGVGLTEPVPLGIPGEDAPAVEDAIDFIARLRQTEPKSSLALRGDVIVIGGGNTAIDAAVQARKLGAEIVYLVYRRGPEHMGATHWEQDLARLNGVIFRHWARPVAIADLGDAAEVTFERTRLADGRLEGTGENFSLRAAHVFKAVGQRLAAGGLEELRREGGKLWVDDRYRTSLPGVFAGGDCIARTVDLTVQAVEDGKEAARSADAFLKEKES
ncbi:MAG: NAD(P)-dependent oxidoreductase [Rhodothalassiaceae bacterium]